MPLRDRQIVAIDDTKAIRDLLRIALEAHGAKFYGAATALSGLEMVQKIQPDLVVLDLGLPDIDGLTLLPRLKSLPLPRTLPVLVLTVRKDPIFKQTALGLGADGYLTKPFVMEDLIDAICQQFDKNVA